MTGMIFRFSWDGKQYVMKQEDVEGFLEEKTKIRADLSNYGSVRWVFNEPIETPYDFEVGRVFWIHTDLYDLFLTALEKRAKKNTRRWMKNGRS